MICLIRLTLSSKKGGLLEAETTPERHIDDVAAVRAFSRALTTLPKMSYERFSDLVSQDMPFGLDKRIRGFMAAIDPGTTVGRTYLPSL